MKKIDLGQAIGVLANLGVIAGIVFLGTQFLVTTEWSFGEAVRSGDDLDAYAKRVRSVIDREDLHYGAVVAWPVFRETANPDYVRWFEESVLSSAVE